jgi:hypothetical protein
MKGRNWAERVSPSVRTTLVSCVLISIACAAVGHALGKDISWDQRHFHYFLGYTSLYDRFALDYYPVSVQSYALPYSYLPFYLLASSPLTDHAVVIALGLLHAPALWAAWYIGGCLVGESSGSRFNVLGAWLSAVLAALSPIFLSQLGTSFNDLPTAIPLLIAAALALQVPDVNPHSLGRRAIAVGFLLGVASALKLSNIVSAIGVVVMLVLLTPGIWQKLRVTALLGAFSALSMYSVGGYWWWRVRSEFGIPFPFEPLLGRLFKPSAETAAGVAHIRYMPVDWMDALLRPLWMASPENTVYIDFPAPDVRFIALNVLLVVALIFAVAIARRAGVFGLREEFIARPRLWALSIGFLIVWPVWLMTSGNGRYLTPWFLLVGPLCIGLVWRLISRRRFRFYALSLLLAAQGYVVLVGSQLRYDRMPWSANGSWYDIEMPRELVEQPAVYITIGVESGAFVFPLLHRDSSFISAGGQKMLATDMAEWKVAQARIEHFPNRPIYMVLPVMRTSRNDGRHVRPERHEVDALVSGIGMRSRSEVCKDIWVDGVPTMVGVAPSIAGEPTLIRQRPMLIVACPIERTATRDPVIEEARARAGALLDVVAKRCPLLFPTPAPFTFYEGSRWVRHYIATETTVWVDDYEVSYTRHNFYQRYVAGTPAQVGDGEFALDCSLRRPALPKMAIEPPGRSP